MRQVAIIGAGSFGRAIEHVLRHGRRLDVAVWDKDESKVPGQGELSEAVSGADAVFLCVNSWTARSALSSLQGLLKDGAIIVSPIKGLEEKTLKTMDQVIGEVLPGQPYALLCGPMLAAEMMENKSSFAALASERKDVFREMESLFSGTSVQVEYSSDVRGVALAGVLKNVYAVGLGMVQALGFENDVHGWYVSNAVREMGRILEVLDGKRETAYGLAGLGDLVATGFSKTSRNCRAGKELALSGNCATVSEGVASLPQMSELVAGSLEEFAILDMLKEIVINKREARELFEAHAGRHHTQERAGIQR